MGLTSVTLDHARLWGVASETSQRCSRAQRIRYLGEPKTSLLGIVAPMGGYWGAFRTRSQVVDDEGEVFEGEFFPELLGWADNEDSAIQAFLRRD